MTLLVLPIQVKKVSSKCLRILLYIKLQGTAILELRRNITPYSI